MWLRAVGDVFALGFAICINPLAVMLVVLLLLAERGRAKAVDFAAGWYVSVVVVAGAGFLLADAADVETDDEIANGIDVVRLGFGIVLIVLAVRQWQKRPKAGAPAVENKLFTQVGAASLAETLVFGVATATLNVKTIPLALSAGAQIASMGLGTGEGLAAAAVFSVVASFGVVTPVAAVVLLGERAMGPLRDFKEWLDASFTAIIVVVFLIIGSILIGDGLALLD